MLFSSLVLSQERICNRHWQVMLLTITGTVKLENTSALIEKYEMGDGNEGYRQIPFDCCNYIKQYKCETCPSFRTGFLTSLKRHQRNGHRNEESEETLYKCLKCLFVSHSKYLMGRHSYFSECATRDENGRKKRFVQYPNDQSDLTLKNEIEEHQFQSELYLTKCKGKISIKCHECAECASKFTRKYSLLRHARLHHSKPEDIQWFKCDQCPHKFKEKRYLKKHYKMCHTKSEDLQWFKCDQCPSKFKRNSTLKNHVQYIHTKPEDIQWFKCDQCPHKCKQKGHLKRHIKARHSKPEDIQWFKCDQCPHKCKQKGNLKTHIKLRHSKPKDIQWFKYDQCPYRCKLKANLSSHFKRRHT